MVHRCLPVLWLAACLGGFWPTAVGAAIPGETFLWDSLGAVAEPAEGSAVGWADGVILVAGGLGPDGAPSSAITATPPGGMGHALAQRLPSPVTHAASAIHGRGMAIVGGRDGTGWRRDAVLIEWAQESGVDRDTRVIELPDVPETLAAPVAAAHAGWIYVAGRAAEDPAAVRLYRLNPADPRGGWRHTADPGTGGLVPLAVVEQGAAERASLYLIARGEGGVCVLEYDGEADRWRVGRPDPGLPVLQHAAPLGAHHIVAVAPANAHEEPATAWLYHTLTDRWAAVTSEPLTRLLAVASATTKPVMVLATPDGDGSAEVVRLEGGKPVPRFAWLDYVALGGYLALLVAVGFYFSRGERTTHDFFLAGQRIPWWAAALSLMATQVSSIGFIAIPAKTFATDWVYFLGVLSWFVVVPVVTRVYIPFFRRLNVTSAYEYLEARFGVGVRMFGAMAFVLLQIGRMAVVLYLPALVLTMVTGIPLYACVLIMGVLATLYTAAGGMEAVVWTDVLQAVLLMGGALLCVVLALAGASGTWGELWASAAHGDKLRLANPSWDITTSAVWVILLGSVFSRFAGASADQSVIQRYLTTSDERQASRALWGDVAVSIPWAVIVFLMGTALYLFYQSRPGDLAPGMGADAVVPLFVAQQLPMGVSGLIIAAIFAAAMSSLDSSIHSVCTVAITDFYARLTPRRNDRVELLLARGLTVLLGALGTTLALLLASATVFSVFDLFIEIMGLFVGVLAGLFVLGMFTVRAHGTGALLGGLTGALCLAGVKQFTDIHFYLYAVVGVASCVVVGYLLSLVLPGRSQTEGLTIHTLTRRPDPPSVGAPAATTTGTSP